MIQVIPGELFAGFTRFHRAGISTNNAAHTGAFVPGNGRNPWERDSPRYIRSCRVMCVCTHEINTNEEELREVCRKKTLESLLRSFLRRIAAAEVSQCEFFDPLDALL
jgi:hypothetical protein